jgi:hypothetical protein
MIVAYFSFFFLFFLVNLDNISGLQQFSIMTMTQCQGFGLGKKTLEQLQRMHALR